VVYALRRLLVTIPLLLAVSLVVFGLAEVLPGDAADQRFQKNPALKQEWREKRGLDRPFLVRWVDYVGDVARLDLGRSYWDDSPVSEDLWRRLAATFELTVCAMVLAILVGGVLGLLSAAYPRTPVDYAGQVVALMGISVPVFWLGILLLTFTINVLGFPFESNRLPLGIEADSFATDLYLLESLVTLRFGDFSGCAKNLLLPCVTLSTIPMAVVTRMTRSAMLEEMGRDYARTARAKGLRSRRVVLKHVLRNALIPITTITGLQFGQLMGGAVLTERIFGWPGLGSYVVEQAVDRRDTPILVGGILLIAATFVLVNLVVDLLYALIDPRIRRGT